MARKYKYMRKDFGELPVRLDRMTIYLNFLEDRVEATNCLEMTAKRVMKQLRLDADGLKVISVKSCRDPKDRNGKDLKFDHDRKGKNLIISLERPVKNGERLCIRTFTHCFPSDTVLEGIYKDITPPGTPQQYMSQCEMWGFQRIMPVVDDPRAKCTMKTTIEADARYTHMISNGNISRDTNPDGRPVPKPGDKSRRLITYENDIPMSPYLFIAAVGTWDELRDRVTYDNGKSVQLEYLVPRGRTGDARIPMEILKKAILWIKEKQDYEYTKDTYRTICMGKSNFGGMENVGNTTIVTDSALIDEHTMDGYLLYAYQVIVHEFEHNQCGSETTMETPFDMWLNEAYTVDVERQFSAEQFDPDMTRLSQVENIRGPLSGPLVIEDGGYPNKIARDGFNHPDNIVDSLTYVKAAEVIRMLRIIMGEKFKKGKALYFSRYRNKNANSDQFFECFEEVWGESLERFKRGWLFRTGYPRVTAETAYDGKRQEFRIKFRQEAKGEPFHIPVELALVDSGGRDIPGTSRVFHFQEREAELVLKGVKERPAFASLNRDYSFYGTFKPELTTEELVKQVRFDPNRFNRVEAMRQLTDIQRIRLLKDPKADIDQWWIDLFGEILGDRSLSPSLKSRLLLIGEEPLDRQYLAWYQEQVVAKERLMKAINRAHRERLIAGFKALDTYRKEPMEKGIERRMLKSVLLGLIAAEDSPESHKIITEHYKRATTPTDRVTALIALGRSSSPKRREILESAYRKWHRHISGYSNYLGIIPAGTNDDVWEMIEAEKKRDPFDITQPTYTRSLLIPMAFNTKMVWTDRGLRWLRDTVIEFSPINTILASRLLNTFQLVDRMKPELKRKVTKHLNTIVKKVKDNPTLLGQARGYLGRD
jgi:aminopeptidase N